MPIIKIKKNNNFTTLLNSSINDARIPTKYLGVFVRLMSKPNDWEISASGLAALFPTEGKDYYNSGLKALCKCGYLIRIPNPRKNGRFQKPTMVLYEVPQFDGEISDEDVAILFGKEIVDLEDIKKIFTKRMNPRASICALQSQQQKKDQSYSTKKKDNSPNPAKEASPVVVFPIFNELEIPDDLKFKLSAKMDSEKASKLVQRVKSWTGRESDAKSCNVILKQWDTWKDEVPKEDRISVNKLWAKEVLKSFSSTLVNIQFCMDGIQAGHELFNYLDKNFQVNIRKLLEKVKNIQAPGFRKCKA